MKRIFIVGVARSGTTLLQSMLASHPEIHSFPETHFFVKLPKIKLLRFFRFISKQENQNVINYIRKNGFENIFKYQSKYTFSKKKWAKHVFDLLDNITTYSKKNIWEEKTPLHLYYTDLITSADNNAVFIHVVREGKDNIASLFDASNKYPEYFRQQSLDSCINRYNKEIKMSISRINQENHFFVKYENIIKNPDKTMCDLFEKLNISYDKSVLDYKKAVSSIKNTEEKWKQNNTKDLSFSNKYNIIFNEEQKSIISRKTTNIDLSIFDD